MRFLLLFLPLIAFANPEQNAQLFGVLTLLPPFIAIVLAIITKEVILALFIAVFSGAFMLNIADSSIFDAIIAAFREVVYKILNSLASKGNAGVVLQVLSIGGTVALITKTGGMRVIAHHLAAKAQKAKSSQFATWLMGFVVFFDDYANALIVGPIMRPLTDRFKISREKLAFIVDSTAAPIAGIAIVSTWIGMELSVIRSGYDLVSADILASLNLASGEINAFEIFMQTLPYRFYNLFMLIFVVMTIYMGREFGPMLKSERAASVIQNDAQSGNTDSVLEPKSGIKLYAINAIVPLLILIIFAFIGFYFTGYENIKDVEILQKIDAEPLSLFALQQTFGASTASVVLFQAALLASIVAICMGIYFKAFSLKEGVATWLHGAKTMTMIVIILLCAWALTSIIKELGTSLYLVDLLSAKTPLIMLPGAIFLFASITAFSTGTSYGTMGILMPLIIPLAISVGLYNELQGANLHQYTLFCISGVLSGAIFGDHCSPISDTTILSSMGAKCDLIAHVKTQTPYCVSVCLISLICGYIPITLGVSVWLCWLAGILAMTALLMVLGRKV